MESNQNITMKPDNMEVRAWTMGLSGWAGKIANMTAVAFVCVILWFLFQETMRVMREERQMFREEITKEREHHEQAMQRFYQTQRTQTDRIIDAINQHRKQDTANAEKITKAVEAKDK